MFLTTTKPDIMYIANHISMIMEFSKEMYLLVAKQVLGYLKGTINYGLLYKSGERSYLFDFTNCDYVGDLDDRKSTFVYVFMMGSTTVSWSSKKQSIVTFINN